MTTDRLAALLYEYTGLEAGEIKLLAALLTTAGVTVAQPAEGWHEVPCCYSLHEIEQRCPRTGRTFWDKDTLAQPAPEPSCCELACYEDPGCACEGCAQPAPDRLAALLHTFACNVGTGAWEACINNHADEADSLRARHVIICCDTEDYDHHVDDCVVLPFRAAGVTVAQPDEEWVSTCPGCDYCGKDPSLHTRPVAQPAPDAPEYEPCEKSHARGTTHYHALRPRKSAQPADEPQDYDYVADDMAFDAAREDRLRW